MRVGTVGATGGSHITAVIPLLKREVELPQLGGGGGDGGRLQRRLRPKCGLRWGEWEQM